MTVQPDKKQLYAYFRMALVTGLVDQKAIIAWADRLLVVEPEADFDLVRLSMAANQSLSQVAWLLNDLQCDPRDDLPYRLALARAALLLQADGSRAVDIIEGIRLLEAEYYLPKDLRIALGELDGGLAMLRLGEIEYPQLAAGVTEFLAGFEVYRASLPQLD